MTKLKPNILKLFATALILAGFLVLPYLLNMLASLPMDGTPDFESKVRAIVQDELVKHGLLRPLIEEDVYGQP